MILEINTNVTLWLQKKEITFQIHKFDYEPGGGTARSSRLLGISEHQVIKSLVFESSERVPLLVLMHGDQSVDTKKLAQELALSKIWSCAPEIAEKASGWPVGSTNPFILKTPMPVYMEESVQKLDLMFINGGGRGVLVSLKPDDFLRVVPVQLVRCAKEKPVLPSMATK